MKNFIQPGKSLPVTVAGAKSSGDGHETGANGLVGVLQADVAAGETVEMLIEGVVELPRDSADTFTAWTKVYWNEAAGEVTTDVAETEMGMAVESQAAGAGTIKVKLLGHIA